VLAPQEEVACGVARVMAHVVAHVGPRVVRVVRIHLGMEVRVVLLDGCLAGGRLQGPAGLAAPEGPRTRWLPPRGRQLDAEAREVLGVRLHATEEVVHGAARLALGTPGCITRRRSEFLVDL
jgi:hypothetical protein